MATSTVLAVIGAAQVSMMIMRFIEWLDTPRTKKAPHPGKPTKAPRM